MRTFEQQVSEMSIEQLTCRRYQHAWKTTGGVDRNRRRRELAIGIICENCGLEASDVISSVDGHTITRKIDMMTYGDGYLLKGVGRVTKEMRAYLSLELFKEKEREERKVRKSTLRSVSA